MFVNGEDVRGGRFAATHTPDQGLGEWRIPFQSPGKVGPEETWTYFHPGRVDVRFAPPHFMAQLQAIDPRLSCTWHPIKERWVVWFRDPTVTFWMCPGWKLVMPWANPYRRDAADNWGYLPLDERCLANVWDRCGRVHGSGLKYWERIQAEVIHDKMEADKKRRNLTDDIAGDYYDYRQIKNIGKGNKFSESHAE